MQWIRRLFGRSVPRRQLPSDEQIARWIERDVRSGYGTADEVADNLRDYLGTHPKASDWLAQLEVALGEQREREARWLDVTHNDRLDRAFAQLETRGLIALQDASTTMSDSWNVVGELAAERPDAWGAVFFHRQDVEAALAGEPLHLAFGAFDEGPAHEARSLALGRDACDELQRHGIATTWNNQIERRIQLSPFEWRKRRWTQAP